MAADKKRDAVATYNAAYAACGELWFKEHLKPTVALIGQRIGIQHNVVISRALKDWKADVDFERLVEERLAAARTAQPPRDARLDQALAGVVRMAQEEARREFEALREDLERERAALRAETEAARAEVDRIRREWEAYRSAAEQARADLLGQLAQREAEIAALRDSERGLRAALAAAEAQRAAQTATLAEREAAAAKMLEALEERFEADHAWHLRRIAEERDAAQRAAEDRIERLQRRIGELETEAQASASLRDLLRRQMDILTVLQREWAAWRSDREADQRPKPWAPDRGSRPSTVRKRR
jgi:chromosome segregation ATPase